MWYTTSRTANHVEIRQADALKHMGIDSTNKTDMKRLREFQKRGQFLMLKTDNVYYPYHLSNFKNCTWYVSHPDADVKTIDHLKAVQHNQQEKSISILHLLAENNGNSWYHPSHNSAIPAAERYIQVYLSAFNILHAINERKKKLNAKPTKKKPELNQAQKDAIKKEIETLQEKWQTKLARAEEIKASLLPKVYHNGRFTDPNIQRRYETLMVNATSNKSIPRKFHAEKHHSKQSGQPRAPHRGSAPMQHSEFQMPSKAPSFYF